jgi:hypothetical protein
MNSRSSFKSGKDSDCGLLSYILKAEAANASETLATTFESIRCEVHNGKSAKRWLFGRAELKFSQRWLWGVLSSGVQRRVVAESQLTFRRNLSLHVPTDYTALQPGRQNASSILIDR